MAPWVRAHTLRRRFARLPPATLALAWLALVIVVLALSSVSLKRFRDVRDRIRHADDVTHALGHTLRLLDEAETGQRGFLLTGRPWYLDPFERARRELPSAKHRLDELLRDDPAEASRLPALDRLVDAKLEELEETVDLEKAGKHDRALEIVTGDVGLHTMAAIRDLEASMRTTEHAILAERQAAASRLASFSFYGVATASGLLLLVGLLVHAVGREAARAEHRERMTLEALYQVTFTEAPIGIGHVGLDGKWLHVNPRLAAILGRPAEGLLTRGLRDDLVESQRARFDADVRQVIEGSVGRHRGEYCFTLADGKFAWIVLTVSLIRDTEGRPVQLALMEDVTEEKRLAGALAASERRFTQLAEMGFIGVFETARDGIIEVANPAFCDMIGRSAEDVHAHRVSYREVTPEEYEAADERAWEALATTGACGPYEKEFLRNDGRRVTALVGGVGNDTKLIGCALDVTALKDVARQRARALRELEDSVRARDDFLALAAHELRTPLTPLMLRLDGMLHDLRANSEPLDRSFLTDELRAIRRTASRATELVETLLEASRVTVGSVPLDLESVDLAATARDVVARMRPESEQARCAVTLHADAPVVGLWDRARLEQIMANLLANALKYGANAPVEIRVEAAGKNARFEIEDHGIGIAPAQHGLIFERFGRAAHPGHYAGLGIGLWIVRQLAEASGGSVRVESNPGEGSRFIVELPRAAPSAQPTTEDIPASPA